MKAFVSKLFLVPFLISCASVAEPAQETGTGQPEEPELRGAFRPLRFGDPEGKIGYDAVFFPGSDPDPDIPTPESILGQLHGSRLSHHAEIVACFRAWAETSPRVKLFSHGVTHEGRELIHAVVTAPSNHARLDEILADIGRLADPRGLSDGDADRIIASTPAVAWMGYSIHGDELSGSDGGVALGYHLAASRTTAVEELLGELVIVIDPCLNPDGRERIIGMVEQSAGYTPNLDYASMQRGRWPFGRGNHYLFDMNRDWMAGTQPETQGRWRAGLKYKPQLFVDAHEMGSQDTFLFYPQAEPLNPAMPSTHTKWQRAYAEDAAKAFDAFGWSYYTREWADGWAPFYSDSWGSLMGGTGILYEQASTAGFPLRRASGVIQTYREAVHHQAVASLSNLTTLARRRADVLRDYLANKRRSVSTDEPGNQRMFILPLDAQGTPGAPVGRTRELLRILLGQGVEVFRVTDEFAARNVRDAYGANEEERAIPAGSLVVPAAQPQGQMVRAYLEFDVRMPESALLKERRKLERKGQSTIYDMTSWSLVHALGLPGLWADATSVEMARIEELPPQLTNLVGATGVGDNPAVAWVVDGWDDSAVGFAARAMEQGLAVHVGDKPFEIGARKFVRGSLLVRRHENEGSTADIQARVMTAAREAGVHEVVPVRTGLAPGDTPDLGGQHFQLLARPRVALLSNSPVAPDRYGHLWYYLDRVLGVPFSILDTQSLRGVDLRRYNVLILPPSRGLQAVLGANQEALQTWVDSGGTLIACADAAAALTKGRLDMSSVTLRRHALEDLSDFQTAARRDFASLDIELDLADVWGDGLDEEPATEAEEEGDEKEDSESKFDDEQDTWMRKFSPRGVTVRGIARGDHWLTYGCEQDLPVLVSGSSVFLSDASATAAIRLAPEASLRLAGLLWPEARQRLAESAWLTTEGSGKGQIVLFAAMPGFRGYQLATGRLFGNAVIYGPGLGARQPIGW